MTKIGCDVKIKSIQEEDELKICVGSWINYCSPQLLFKASIMEPL